MPTVSLSLQCPVPKAIMAFDDGSTASRDLPLDEVEVTWGIRPSFPTALERVPHYLEIEIDVTWSCVRSRVQVVTIPEESPLLKLPAVQEALAYANTLQADRRKGPTEAEIKAQAEEDERRRQAMAGPWADWSQAGGYSRDTVKPVGDDGPPPDGWAWVQHPSVVHGLTRAAAVQFWVTHGGTPPWEL